MTTREEFEKILREWAAEQPTDINEAVNRSEEIRELVNNHFAQPVIGIKEMLLVMDAHGVLRTPQGEDTGLVGVQRADTGSEL